MNKIQEVFESWGAGRNALLYGPPATGKTRLISCIFDALKNPPESARGILLDASDSEDPFSRPAIEITIPQPAKVVWTTFHQSYGYEDFVLALRPEVSGSGTRLQPWAGVFLDAALELNDDETPYESVVIFIDEINRGNAARIFGEFMTFLDFDYRDDGSIPLPVPLRQLTFTDSVSEEIKRPSGAVVTIPEGFTFPRHIYIVATMNSVDRAAVPIDSALARRFDRIEMRPNLGALAEHWGIDVDSVTIPDEDTYDSLTPYETGYLLLDRLNVNISSDLGPEFELGHGLLTPARAVKEDAGTPVPDSEDAAWRALARIWDDVLFPQLEDRYSGRPEQLLDLLHVESPPPDGEYAWRLRKTLSGEVAVRTLAPVRLSDLELDVARRSIQWLTR